MQSVTALGAALDLGGNIDILKILPLIVLLFVWGKLLSWADKDAVAAHLPRELLNTVFFGALVGAFVLFFILPNFWIGLGSVVFVFLASVGTYLALRNRQVGLADLKKELAALKGGLGKGRKKKEAKPGEVQFFNKKGAAMVMPQGDEPERPGYEAAQAFFTEALRKGAEQVDVRPGEEGSVIAFAVDGVGYPGPAMDKEAGQAGITYIKSGARLDVEDRRKPQTGVMRAQMDGKKHDLEVSTAGTTAGESMRVIIDPKNRFTQKLAELGMLPEQLATMEAVIAEPRGVVILCTPRQQGLTTLEYAVIGRHDAFTCHIQTVEHNPKQDMEGVTQNKLAANCSPQEEFKQVEWVASQEPDILMVDEIVNPASARELVKYVGTGKRAYVGLRAGSTFEALTLWRKLVGNDQQAMDALLMVVAGRVLRRLCTACKVGYAPEPEMLRKLGMDPAKVSNLFQAREEPLRDNKGRPIPCTFCNDLHYKGRFGLYEMLVVDEDVRQAVAQGGSSNQIKAVFRKQRGRLLEEVAMAQVQAGETSVKEVLRVLRASDTRPRAARPAAPAPAKQ